MSEPSSWPTPDSPSMVIPLNAELGLGRGDGSVYIHDIYNRHLGYWSERLRVWHGKSRDLFVRQVPVLVERRKEYRFLHYGAYDTPLRNFLQDGICLGCGELNPLILQCDHVLGRQRHPRFIISLCANCHHLKSTKRFLWLERRIGGWLDG